MSNLYLQKILHVWFFAESAFLFHNWWGASPKSHPQTIDNFVIIFYIITKESQSCCHSVFLWYPLVRMVGTHLRQNLWFQPSFFVVIFYTNLHDIWGTIANVRNRQMIHFKNFVIDFHQFWPVFAISIIFSPVWPLKARPITAILIMNALVQPFLKSMHHCLTCL